MASEPPPLDSHDNIVGPITAGPPSPSPKSARHPALTQIPSGLTPQVSPSMHGLRDNWLRQPRAAARIGFALALAPARRFATDRVAVVAGIRFGGAELLFVGRRRIRRHRIDGRNRRRASNAGNLWRGDASVCSCGSCAHCPGWLNARSSATLDHGASRPREIERQHVARSPGAQHRHQQAVDAQRDACAARASRGQRGEQRSSTGGAALPARAADGLVALEALRAARSASRSSW